MKSQIEVEREYKQLLHDVATDRFYKIDLTNRVNCYVCEKCGNVTKTIDVDAGVTPYLILCESCGSDGSVPHGSWAKSSFYKDIAPDLKPTLEWYRPSLNEVLNMRSEQQLEHVLRGGLISRVINKQQTS